MPEGPEVKMFGRLLQEKLAGKYISTFDISSGRYETKLPDGFEDFYVPSKVLAVKTRGKLLYILLENSRFIWQTFGMTGYWSEEKQPHTRFIINESLYYSDQRNFGTIKFNMSRLETLDKIGSLGFDLLNDNFKDQELISVAKMVMDQNRTLAQVLMDQKRFAGVGNYIKAEALYRAKLSPWRKGSDLSGAEALKLVGAIRDVMHESWKSKPYGTFKKVVYKRMTDPLGNEVVRETTLDDRTTHWVPSIQK